MKQVIIFLFAVILYSCNKTVDLSTVEVGGDAQQYDLDSNKNLQQHTLQGYYGWQNINDKLVLTFVKKGEKTNNYLEINKLKNQFNYSGFPTDSTWDIKIVVYEGKIAEINATFSKESAFQVAESLIKKLGKPTFVNNETRNYDDKIDRSFYPNFKKYFPNDTDLKIDSLDYYKQFTHPRDVLWDNEKTITILGFYLDYENLRVEFKSMSRKAFFDNVLYPPPTEKNPFYEYFKKKYLLNKNGTYEAL